MIYNPWFERRGIDAVVVPMGVMADDYPAFLRSLFRLSNIRGALVTMPHKVTTVALLDEVSVAVKVAGSCNAILRRADGSLYLAICSTVTRFTRGAKRRGFDFAGADCLVVRRGRRRLGNRRGDCRRGSGIDRAVRYPGAASR